MDNDGRLEVFLGNTTPDSLAVRPFTFGAAGEVREYVWPDGLAFEECCTQDTVMVTAPDVWRRWFSCVEPSGGQLAQLVWGRYQISEEGLVRWTDATLPLVAAESVEESGTRIVALVPEIFEVSVEGEPTDAWIPGNGCRSGNGVWRAPASLEFAEDGTAELIEISGLPDDSVAALRWEVTFTEDGSSVVDLQHAWACQPGRGHESFSTKFCL